MDKPRRIVPDDLPWITELSLRRYGDGDQACALDWMHNQVIPDPHGIYLPLRTADAFLIAGSNRMPWSYGEAILVLVLITDEGALWQGVQLLRASLEWAKLRKAVRWAYHWDHGDAGVLCRRIGAVPTSPRYEVNLSCHPPESLDLSSAALSAASPTAS